MKIKKTYQGTVPENKIVNTYTESGTDTYGCDYINSMDVYSTNETKTNKVWIDNKPIYRKILNIGNLASSTGTINYTHNISNIDVVVNQEGFITNGTEFIPFNSVYRATSTSDQYDLGLLADKTKIVYSTKQNRSNYTGYVMLEYTKTTD